jgi:hypothetical protein
MIDHRHINHHLQDLQEVFKEIKKFIDEGFLFFLIKIYDLTYHQHVDLNLYYPRQELLRKRFHDYYAVFRHLNVKTRIEGNS